MFQILKNEPTVIMLYEELTIEKKEKRMQLLLH